MQKEQHALLLLHDCTYRQGVLTSKINTPAEAGVAFIWGFCGLVLYHHSLVSFGGWFAVLVCLFSGIAGSDNNLE